MAVNVSASELAKYYTSDSQSMPSSDKRDAKLFTDKYMKPHLHLLYFFNVSIFII